MALSVAELKAIASLDSKPFKAGMGKVTSSAKTGSRQLGATMGAGLKKMAGMIGAAFAVRAVIRFGAAQMQAADRTMDLVNALGLSAEQFQALEQSAEQYGGTTENVQKAMMQLRRVQGDVIGGNIEYAESFRVLGVSQKDLENSTLPQLLEKVAKGYKAAGGSATAYNAASELLGRGGKELTGVLMDVANNGLQGIIDKGIEAGTVLSNEVVKGLSDANNELEKATRIWKNYWTVQLAGAIKRIRFEQEYRKLAKESGKFEVIPSVAVLEQQAWAKLSTRRPEKLADAAAVGVDEDKVDTLAKMIQGIKTSAPKAADSFAKIGGIIGGQTSKDTSLFERQLKVHEAALKVLETDIPETIRTEARALLETLRQ